MLGSDGARETLTRIDGESGPDGWRHVVPDAGLRSFAQLLREFHDATRGFGDGIDCRWAFGSGAPRPGEVVCHGDFGPWNVVWRDGRPVGLLDFDFAEPGGRIDDVAYALDYAVPFCDDDEALRWRSYEEPPDRPSRIEVFLGAYGWDDRAGIVDAVIERRQLDIEHVRSLAERGFEPQRSWVSDGMLDELASRTDWVRANRSLFE